MTVPDEMQAQFQMFEMLIDQMPTETLDAFIELLQAKRKERDGG